MTSEPISISDRFVRTRRAPAINRGAVRVWACGALLFATICLGCKTTPSSTGVPLADAIASEDSDIAALDRGRRIYMTDCTRCHAPVPIADHTLEEWQNILPSMIEISKLDAAKTRDVTDYVFTAHRAVSLSRQSSAH